MITTTTDDAPVTVTVISFGYGHGPAPEAELTIDARRYLRNPHDDPAMRYLTGLDPAVHQHVMNTPGAQESVYGAVDFALNVLAATVGQPVTIAVGCAGGRHRSVVLAREIAAELQNYGDVRLTHRDVERPVLQSAVKQLS
ncbi:ATPase [Streptosporangium sp. NPDC050855]|uniref:RapZ C-terminal domain-containing protein n=1 Tax=Streptosporangium sp. NPDC050855 TaxID=3366194 RepID=UPI0037BDA441